MKSHPDREHLLQELGNDVSSGPSVSAVLGLLRAERVRRRQRIAGIAGGLALGLSVWLGLRIIPSSRPDSQVNPRPAQSDALALRRVDDNELLKLLTQQEQPVALLKLPGGKERLLFVSGDGVVTAAN